MREGNGGETGVMTSIKVAEDFTGRVAGEARKAERSWRDVRGDFPITERYAYLLSAATGPLAPDVAAAITQYLGELTTSGDAAFSEWIERRERARVSVARMINADPDEVAFTANTSQGMNLIVDALEGKGAVISCKLEFPVTTLPWMHRGVAVNMLDSTEGALGVDEIERAMTKETGVVCLSHVQYSNGLRLDLGAIGERKGDHAFVVNASQSAGVLPIDVRRMKIDALCATGHKWLLAGLGTGFVYMSRELLARTRPRQMSWMSVPDPFAMRNDDVSVRPDMAARAEIGIPQLASIFALGAAVDYLSALGWQNIEARSLELNRHLTARLSETGWRVLSPLRTEATRSAETLVGVAEPARTVERLAARGVRVSQKPEGIRVATHFYNNEEDIERLVVGLEELGR